MTAAPKEDATSTASPASFAGLAFPKPVRVKKSPKPLSRGKPLRRTAIRRKPGKPIKRRKPLRGRSARDPACFKPRAIGAVWGPRPTCVLSDSNEFEMHHVMGRGYEFGYRPAHPDRALFSSPFNSAPLSQHHHKGGARDKPAVRWRLLEIAAEAVFKAVGEGFYELTDIDSRFVAEVAIPWMEKNPA